MDSPARIWQLIKSGNMAELTRSLLTYQEQTAVYELQAAKHNAKIYLHEYQQGNLTCGLSRAMEETRRALRIYRRLINNDLH